MGWAESVSITIVTMTARNQAELGSASGVAGSLRFLISSIASTVYNVILANKRAQYVPPRVTAAVEAAGLPASSVTAFLAAIGGTGGSVSDVPGVNANIISVGTSAYQEANTSAFRVVFLSTIAFSAIGIISTFLLPNVDHLLTGGVAATLHPKQRSKKDDV
jgi:Fungal trichothecene efflux pump (TRI12)